MSRWLLAALMQLLLWGSPVAWGVADQQLVFGSFRDHGNAVGWAEQLTQRFDHGFQVERVLHEDGTWFRVRSGSLTEVERVALERAALAQGLNAWVIRGVLANPDTITSAAPAGPRGMASGRAQDAHGQDVYGQDVHGQDVYGRAALASSGSAADESGGLRWGRGSGYADVDLGVQTRAYRQSGLHGQSSFQPSVSARLQFHRNWDDGRSSVTFTPFVRLDAEDDQRTRADVRELFWTRIGDDWELHVGARQIFWGVTEFNHLVDIINQSDLAESLDGEDKLGQPMVQLSLVRDWGIVDLFLLSGFRERTFPGEDGRLRSAVPVDTGSARYASGAGRSRVDGAVRWSHHVGPLSFGAYHFSGTSRDPRLVAEYRPGTDQVVLVPEYHVIDQTGVDAQAIFGDWAWKLETISRSGHGGRYFAYTAGFERTLVGVLGTRSDLGLVAEYMYDQRGVDAVDTLFENDLALGTRWQANDMADTTALVGVIWDTRTREYVLSLEASRRLGSSWTAVLEGRLFGGADPLRPGMPLPQLLDARHKTRPLQRDDFVQLELTRYF